MAGADTLHGGEGADVLDGGAGADLMLGGLGNDTYVVDNAGDTVAEDVNEGIDQVNSTISYYLWPNLENLTLLGSANINGTGNDLANVMTGNSGDNQFTGNGGNDTFIFANGCGDDTITDFAAGAGIVDLINIAGFGFADFNAVQAVTTDIGGSAVIQLDTDDTLTLQGVLEAQLASDDFLLA